LPSQGCIQSDVSDAFNFTLLIVVDASLLGHFKVDASRRHAPLVDYLSKKLGSTNSCGVEIVNDDGLALLERILTDF